MTPDDLARELTTLNTETTPMGENTVPRGAVCPDHAEMMEYRGEVRQHLRGIELWLAKIDAKLDDGVKSNGRQDVEIGNLKTKVAIYAAIVAAIVSPVVAAVTVGLLKLAGG